jgi:hypothetical protein
MPRNVLRAAITAALTALALPALAHDVIYIASLSGPNEAPPNASPGTGSAKFTINEDTFTMRMEASFSGLLGNSTNAHIHCCTTTPGAGTAGVATPLPSFPAFPSGVKEGTYDRTFDMTLPSSWNGAFITANGGTTGTAFSALLAGIGSGRAYLNLHSTSFGGGEIRGFLQPVPEPETYALMLAGLGLVGATAWRKRQAAA